MERLHLGAAFDIMLLMNVSVGDSLVGLFFCGDEQTLMTAYDENHKSAPTKNGPLSAHEMARQWLGPLLYVLVDERDQSETHFFQPVFFSSSNFKILLGDFPSSGSMLSTKQGIATYLSPSTSSVIGIKSGIFTTYHKVSIRLL